MGNIESIQVAYDRTKSYIVYDSFQYIMIAIVVFLIGMKLWDEWQKNLSSNNHRFDVAAYWGQVKICLVVCFIATSAGMVFHLVETVCVELQDNLINDLGGDTGNKSIETMTNMVKNQVLAVQEKESKGLTLDIPNITDIVWKALTAIVMSVGVFLFKYTYTFFILGRYMWLFTVGTDCTGGHCADDTRKYPELFLYVAEEHDHLLSDDSDVSFGGQVLE